jgi:uncharacterized membrane protein
MHLKTIKNKRGQLQGVLNLPVQVLLSFMIVLAVFFAGLILASTLRSSGVFPAGSLEANSTATATANFSAAGNNFWTQTPTIGTIIGVVLLLGGVFYIIYFFIGRGSEGGRIGV